MIKIPIFLSILHFQQKYKNMRLISGIQQIGVGTTDVYKSWEWYRKVFGADVAVFDEAAVAQLMLPYTGGKPQKRHAILAINLEGGGGFEIWQYSDRKPQPIGFELQLGDLGIAITKIKCKNINTCYQDFFNKGVHLLGNISKNPIGQPHFYLKDPFGNIFEMEESTAWFSNGKKQTGGVFGSVMGVTNMEKSLKFYSEILGYDKIVYDKTGNFEDLAVLPGGSQKYRRVMITHSQPRRGAFSRLFGESQLELFQAFEHKPRKIYEGRFWGDPGYIQLCFDIVGREEFKTFCSEKGHPFTVDSGADFEMGEAAGSFSYIEDPDGTLIELVETYKVPILKKFGWYLNLRKRNPEKPLPDWMLKSMRFNRKKD